MLRPRVSAQVWGRWGGTALPQPRPRSLCYPGRPGTLCPGTPNGPSLQKGERAPLPDLQPGAASCSFATGADAIPGANAVPPFLVPGPLRNRAAWIQARPGGAWPWSTFTQTRTVSPGLPTRGSLQLSLSQGCPGKLSDSQGPPPHPLCSLGAWFPAFTQTFLRLPGAASNFCFMRCLSFMP